MNQGSGNSLMSYEGICFATTTPACPAQNITPYVSTYYFHVNSLIEITNFIMQPGHCVSGIAGSNDVPVIAMPANKTIPKGTPFALTGSATDNNSLTYNWEEYDTDNLSLSCPAGHPNDAANSATAPLFRSFDPSASGSTRLFPKLSDILANTQTMGEILPNVARTINMRLTARDNFGGTNWGSMALTVNLASGPFVINTANTATTYTAGQQVPITWSVANTSAAPVSCANVNILWSNDGGLSFPVTLLANTPNDGTQSVTMPALGTTMGRIKIEAVGNYFFDINNANITISSSCNPLVTSLITTDEVTAAAGAPALNLTMSYGQEVTSFTGSISGSDPSSSNPMRGAGNSNTCSALYTSNYKTISFNVSQTGVYAFATGVSSFKFTSLFSGSFNSASICTNWINANSYNFGGGSYGYTDGTVSATLNAGQVYVLRVAQTGTFTVSLSGAGSVLTTGGSVPSGFTYKYIIVKDGSTPTVKAIDVTANMTNSAIYTSGTYKVYGFMVGTSVNLTSYINQPLSNLTSAIQSGTVCGLMTNNFRPITITGCSPSTKFVTSTSALPSVNGSLSNILAGACLGDTIKFSLPANSTITFTTQLTISTDVVIDGTGMTNLTLSGNNAVRLFEVNAGVTFGVKNIKLINASSSTNGGAIWNKGTLILNGATLDGNKQGAANKALTNDGSISILGNTMIMM